MVRLGTTDAPDLVRRTHFPTEPAPPATPPVDVPFEGPWNSSPPVPPVAPSAEAPIPAPILEPGSPLPARGPVVVAAPPPPPRPTMIAPGTSVMVGLSMRTTPP